MELGLIANSSVQLQRWYIVATNPLTRASISIEDAGLLPWILQHPRVSGLKELMARTRRSSQNANAQRTQVRPPLLMRDQGTPSAVTFRVLAADPEVVINPSRNKLRTFLFFSLSQLRHIFLFSDLTFVCFNDLTSCA